MPSFLNDENSPIYSNNDILDLDPNRQLGLVADKARVNGGSIPHALSSPVQESFDESSATSTHDSETSDTTPMAALNGNSNGTRPTSMNSATNEKSLLEGDGPSGDRQSPQINQKSLPNGSMILPDRTGAPQSLSGVSDATSTKKSTELRPSTDEPFRPTSGSQLSVSTVQNPKRSTDSAATAFPISPSEPELRNSTAQAPNLSSSSPTSDQQPQRNSPHRFSSPPIYQSSNSNSNGSVAGHLQPPNSGPALKQRHTLEVPKLPPSRLSRDGMDTAQASGRFSPTAAATPQGIRRASLNLARRQTRSMQSDAPRDEIVPDEDALRWAEAYRQKRASKRRKRDTQDDDRVLVGTKVDENHANWVTAYNMLTGIRVSVSRTNAKLDRELTDADFETKQKSTFDIAGNELVPSAKYDFKFKDYAPWVFRHLRALFRLDPADYLISLTGKYILSELGSPGKSGSFFYFSRDYKYIIKTIHHAEHKFLRKILKDYYQHVTDNPNTLLSQFYGLHRVKMPYGKKIHFVVMNNLFPPHRDIHTTFDLKGSTIGRNYKEEDLSENPRATLKDLNWLRRQRHLELGIQKKRLFLEQLQRDVVLLKRLRIMDYSLLIGVHDLSRGNEENLRGKTLQVFNPGGEKPVPDDEPQSVLLRTPSKMETARKARELRQMIRQERPIPMGQASDRMPDELGEGHSRPGFVFNQDDGGFQATHEDNSPADEVYYLGIIDCLTHYGIIKKIEHFWKGLSNDRTQISALPPDQYGDRFYNFIEGTTMSPEEAKRDAQLREQEAAAESLQPNRSRRRSANAIPPMPDHQPPAPPPPPRSPEGKQMIDMAREEALRTDLDGHKEKRVPDRTLKTAPTGAETRDSFQHEPILPIVEENGENGRDGSDPRPETPAKDKMLPPTRAPPPTPPKPQSVKTESADSGFSGSNGSNAVCTREAKPDGLNKTLPPLPKNESTEGGGVRMVA